MTKFSSRIVFFWGLVLCPWAMTYLVLSIHILIAQGSGSGQTGIVPIITSDPITEYLTKGGAYGVIGLLLYFYRRDWSKALDFSKDNSEVLTGIVMAATKAQTESALAVSASTQAVRDSTTALSANTAALQRILDRLDQKSKTT